MDQNVEARLKELGWMLPASPKPIAAYVPAVRTGNLLWISGQLPLCDGKLLATGPVGSAVSLEQAQRAAAQCAVNALAIVHAECAGDWSRLQRIVRLGVFVQCGAGYGEQPKVANGASELLVQVLGDVGRHARAAVGVNALPLNATVELEMVVELA